MWQWTLDIDKRHSSIDWVCLFVEPWSTLAVRGACHTLIWWSDVTIGELQTLTFCLVSLFVKTWSALAVRGSLPLWEKLCSSAKPRRWDLPRCILLFDKHQIYRQYLIFLDFSGHFPHNEAGVFANSTRQKPASVREGRKEDQGDLNYKRDVSSWYFSKQGFTQQLGFHPGELQTLSVWIGRSSSIWTQRDQSHCFRNRKGFRKRTRKEVVFKSFSCRWRCWAIPLLKRISGGPRKTKKR